MKKSFKLLFLFIFLIACAFSIFLFYYNSRFYRKLDVSNVKEVYVNKTGKSIRLEDGSAKALLNIVKKLNRRSNYVNDDFFRDDYIEYVLSFVIDDNDSQLVYIYFKNSKYFLYIPGYGTFNIYRDSYDKLLYCFPSFIDVDVSDFYNEDILSKHRIVTELSFNYFVNDDPSVVVMTLDSILNEHLVKEFLNDFQYKKNSFMRILMFDVEGGNIFYDVKYDSDFDKVFVLIYYSSLYSDSYVVRKEFDRLSFDQNCVFLYDQFIYEENSLSFCIIGKFSLK